MIIDNIRKMISRKFVRLKDDGIALVLRDVVNKVSIHQVIEWLTPIAELESDAIFIVFRNLFSDLFWSEISEKGSSDYESESVSWLIVFSNDLCYFWIKSITI